MFLKNPTTSETNVCNGGKRPIYPLLKLSSSGEKPLSCVYNTMLQKRFIQEKKAIVIWDSKKIFFDKWAFIVQIHILSLFNMLH